MGKPKSVADRLEFNKLQCGLNVTQNVVAFNNSVFVAAKKCNGNILEEYPKLRKPKASTLFKIQSHQRKSDISITKAVIIEEDKSLGVPLSQEFLNNKGKLEKANTNFLKKIEVRNSQVNYLFEDFICDKDCGAQPLTLEKKLDLELTNGQQSKQRCTNSPNANNENRLKSLKFFEQLLVNIFYTKVQAHPNGYFAENLPDWYKKTFDKDVNKDWLELLQASNKFQIDKVQNKIVIYTKDNNGNSISNSDLNTTSDKPSVIDYDHKEVSLEVKEVDARSKPPVGFVRFKHLQKSLEEYAKNTDHDNAFAEKNSGKHIKPIITKSSFKK